MIIINLNNGMRMSVRKSWAEFKPLIRKVKMEKNARNIHMDGRLVVSYEKRRAA